MSRHKKQKIENAAISQKLVKRANKIKKQLRDIGHDLILNDRIIQLGLVASGMQLTFSFAYSSSAWYATAWSWVSAAAKATFIEICIWSINRAIAWAGVMQIKRGVAVLWIILATVFFISTRANLQYEYKQKINAHNSREQIINSATVDYYLKADEIFDSWLRGGLIPVLVLGMIAARRLLGTAAESYEREELKRLRDSLRGAEHRARVRQIENTVAGDA